MSIRMVDKIKESEKQAIFSLWQSTLGNNWPIERSSFDEAVFHSTSQYFLGLDDAKIISFLAVQKVELSASVICIFVDQRHQRIKIGSEMIKTAIKELSRQGVNKLVVGSGGNTYIWPGIPTNLNAAVKFFKHEGWSLQEKSVDMILDLTNYVTPKIIFETTNKLGITVKLVSKEITKELLNFEKNNFPDWYKYYLKAVECNNLDNILVAISSNNKIVGSVLLDRDKRMWSSILGNKVGTLGALGVSIESRGQGIGIALAAKGVEILKSNNVEVCYLGWTWLIDWYGKLGFKVWREYFMGDKSI